MKVLFVTARFPAPLLTGDRVRAYHQIRLLSAHHRVTLVSFADASLPAAARQTVASFCDRVITLPLGVVRMAEGLLRRGFSSIPLQAALFASSRMQRTLRDVLRERAYDVAHVQLARMTPHLDEIIDVPRVIDLVDALSLNMRRRFDRESGPMRWAAYLEWLRLRRHERSICDVVDRATVVSSIDRLAIGPYENLVVNSNGVDLRTFPFARQARDAASVVFSGNLGYFPNVGAAAWFAERVWPLVRRAVPEATFRMVGARPHRRLVRLAEGEPSISLAPDVESIHDHLARGQVAVAPMQSGSGQILKVLEAMATGDPVVSTTMGLSGIDARDGEHVLVADTPETFADRVVRLLRDPAAGDRLAQAARRLVEERYTWERSVAELEGIYAAVVRARRDRAADGTSRNCA